MRHVEVEKSTVRPIVAEPLFLIVDEQREGGAVRQLLIYQLNSKNRSGIRLKELVSPLTLVKVIEALESCLQSGRINVGELATKADRAPGLLLKACPLRRQARCFLTHMWICS